MLIDLDLILATYVLEAIGVTNYLEWRCVGGLELWEA